MRRVAAHRPGRRRAGPGLGTQGGREKRRGTASQQAGPRGVVLPEPNH